MEITKLRKQREGKKRINDGAMLDYFKVEHLVAASNDNYTSSQVRTIYGRNDTSRGGGDEPPVISESPVRTMTRRMSGFALGDSAMMMSPGSPGRE